MTYRDDEIGFWRNVEESSGSPSIGKAECKGLEVFLHITDASERLPALPAESGGTIEDGPPRLYTGDGDDDDDEALSEPKKAISTISDGDFCRQVKEITTFYVLSDQTGRTIEDGPPRLYTGDEDEDDEAPSEPEDGHFHHF
nr:hypothetical protein Iba_chr11aCG4560 [Ipomoea batatas]